MNVITLELYRHRFEGIAGEMGVALQRTAYSSNIKDRLDFSCALFNADGQTIAQAAHIPVHLGAMPACVQAVLHAMESWQRGEVAIVNDPFAGGTHLPDITLVAPVFADALDAPDFFIASRAHHADVGGITAGSLPLSREIWQEGVIIPPLKLVEAGKLNEALLELFLRNTRTPDERRGDLDAQRAALNIGEHRLRELMQTHSRHEVLAYARHLQFYAETRTRAAIQSWPNGTYEARDGLEWDENGDLKIIDLHVRLTIENAEVTFDFRESSPQIVASLNATLPITQAACYYVVRCLLDDDIPMNAGCFAPVKVLCESGSIVDARFPAAVAGGNVETSQRIVDLALQAFAKALPDRIPAASQGTMNNLTIGGTDADGRPFAYYETIGGGHGASFDGDGLDGAHSHMTNTLNTPIEAFEQSFPIRITRYAIRAGSGGEGRFRGGDGLVREYEILSPVIATMLSERRHLAPRGINGGKDGTTGRNILIHPDGREETLPSKFSRVLAPGSRLRIETPGGGGHSSAD